MDSTERNSKSLLDLSKSFEKEVFFLVAQFLSGSQCQRAAKALIEELEAHELIPERVNWLGQATSQDFTAFSNQFDHIGHNHLPKILELCVKAANAKCPTSVSINKSLLSSSTLSFLSRASGSNKAVESSWVRRHGEISGHRFQRGSRTLNPVHALLDQAISGTQTNHKLIQPAFFERLHKSCVILGHLSSVYCVLFDVTGNYIFTGADDNLVKIWSATNGRLLHTLRGASAEITDLAVNKENTLLAAGSCDKLIRVWCLRSCAPIAVLNTHSGSVTSVFFCPIPRSRLPISYLASTSTDGSCSFWGYTETKDGRVEFQPRPTIYQERMRPGHAQMICSSFSAGGIFMAAGSADNNVRVYNMLGADGPERILEVEVHSDRVDSISWAHEGLRFISGSKDGTALIWRFENSEWRYVRLYCAKVPGSNVVIQEDPKRRARVTMVAWNADDTLALTAVSDKLVKVWNPKNGELIRVLSAHQDEIFVTESHPFNPRLLCTASHDGRIIIWDIGTVNKDDEGKVVYEHYNILDQGQGHGAVFDCKWAPDGLSLAATDSHGHLLMFTPHPRETSKFAKLPKEMFFHTDYRPLTRDAITNEVLDEQTQVPPHLMPPPFLVDMEGNPYQPEFQRLVPGRENCRDEQLVPNVAVGNGGFQEVIEGLPSNPRSNIDQMIEQLAQQQGVPGENRNVPVPRLSGGPSDRDRRVVGLRRSGDVEGVRQSTGNWQPGNYGFPERKVIMPLNKGLLMRSLETRLGAAEQEEYIYKEHCSKRPSGSGSGHTLTSPSEGISLREARSRRVRRLALEAAERRIRTANGQPNILEIEGVARPNPRPQIEISVNQQSARRQIPINNPGAVRPAARRGNGRPPRNRYNVRRMFEERGAHNESDIENMEIPSDEDSSDEEMSLSHSSSSSSDSDSESDWGGGGNTRDGDNRKRNAPAEGGRKSARKSNAASPKSEDGNNDDSDDEPRPGTSSAATTSPSKPEPKSKPKKTKPKASDLLAGLDEIPPEYRPSEWFAEVLPKRSPYFPQLGDHLVYYRQGHKAYVEEVEKKKAYELSKKMKKSLPYIMIPDLPAAVPVRVVNIKFELKPPRLVCLKLEVQDWETGEFTGTQFNVQYHDMPQVVDFLILRQIHDKYVRHNWNPGDRFRCLIDRYWWFGTVDNFEPNRSFPHSKFLCYNITWDNKEREKMSPWDMDVIPDSFEIPTDSHGSVNASEEDVRSIGLYEVSAVDWPPLGHQDAQCVKLSRLFEQVMGLAISEAFLTPVDINRYPDYAFCIEYPVDLSTIKARLDNRFYRRIDALRFDVKYIATNAESFNQPNSDIVKHAKVIRDLCLELIENPDVQDVNPVYHQIVNSFLSRREAERTTVSKSEDRNLPSTSKSTPSRSDRSSATPASQQNTSSRRSLRNTSKPSRIDDSDDEEEDYRPWQDRCRDLLATISACKDAAPFRAPVNPEEYPNYYQAIDTPMDLQSVREDLLGGNYSSPLDFHKDMNLIFHNSRQYNTDKRSQIYSMTIRLQSMYECQVKPILTSYRSRRKGTKSGSSTPLKKKKNLPTRGASNSNSPRKNPVRNAASKNPYLHGENDDSSDGDDDRKYSTRSNNGDRSGPSSGRKLRSRASTTTSSSNRSVNGHGPHNGVSPPSQSRPQRRVKRFRISSGESIHSHRSNGRGQQQMRSTRLASAGSAGNRKPRYAEDLGSDEFEDSDDVPMPHLHAAAEGDSDDASNSDHEASRGSLRRSSRVQKLGKKRRSIFFDNESDEHSYGTRYRGKPRKNYDERDGSSGDEDNMSRKSKRRRLESRSVESPPRKLRRQETSPKKSLSKEDEEDEEEEEEEDPNQPGPSSRMLSTRRSARNKIVEEEDEEDVEEDENDDEDLEEEEEEEASSDDDVRGSKRRSTRLKKKPDRHNYSDEDANQSPPRSRRHDDTGSRRTRGTARPDYAEDSDSEPDVSSRGRVRRKKSFLG